jgi:hypothetical protein
MFILRSWSGQALSLLESSRISSEVTWPGLPRGEPSSANGTLVDVALSGAISSIVDLKRTAGGAWDCWEFWGSVGISVEPRFSQPESATRFAIASFDGLGGCGRLLFAWGRCGEGQRFFLNVTFFANLRVLGIRRHAVRSQTKVGIRYRIHRCACARGMGVTAGVRMFEKCKRRTKQPKPKIQR